MLYADALRGWDATGCFGVNKHGNVDIKKMAVPAGFFTTCNQFMKFKGAMLSHYQIVIGHNRKATHGAKRHEDAHPFWDKNENIVLVHNGMISNHKELCKESTVDSAAVTNALAETEDPKEILSNLDGAYALIWYNVKEKKLYLARNSARPLYIIESPDLIVLSSEAGLGQWICGRNDVKITSYQLVKEQNLFSIDLDKKTITDHGEYKKKVFYTTTTHVNPTYFPRSQEHPALVLQAPKTGMMNGIVDSVNDTKSSSVFNQRDLPVTCFYSDMDFKNIEDCVTKYRKGNTIFMDIKTYQEHKNEKTGEIIYVVRGIPINVDKPYLVVSLRMDKIKFDKFDLTHIHEVEIATVTVSDERCTLHVKEPLLVQSRETQNGLVITEDMWMDQAMPDHCDVCSAKMFWKDLIYSNIWLENGEVSAMCCPKCSHK